MLGGVRGWGVHARFFVFVVCGSCIFLGEMPNRVMVVVQSWNGGAGRRPGQPMVMMGKLYMFFLLGGGGKGTCAWNEFVYGYLMYVACVPSFFNIFPGLLGSLSLLGDRSVRRRSRRLPCVSRRVSLNYSKEHFLVLNFLVAPTQPLPPSSDRPAAMYRCAQEFQRVLTDFQGCEEQLVSEAQDGMRKHVVFESSSLANQQYDLQMLFKVEMDECLGAGGWAGGRATLLPSTCSFVGFAIGCSAFCGWGGRERLAARCLTCLASNILLLSCFRADASCLINIHKFTS